jgi:hypothetical protein
LELHAPKRAPPRIKKAIEARRKPSGYHLDMPVSEVVVVA